MPELDESTEEGGGRPFWSGTLSFGLVSVPVDLLPAHTSARASLRMLDADGTPLARRYYNPADDEEVDAEHLVRGREVDGGKVVVVTDEELEALAPQKSREIDLRRFVDRDSIDPLYFERSYFLAPGKGSGKAYRLLTAVMERSRRAGIATFVMREKEYLVAIFAEGGLLRGETLRFADQVRSTRSVGLPKPARVDATATKRMSRAVSALVQKTWDPDELTDPHEAIRELAQRKFKKGEDVIRHRASERDEGGEIVDLMQVLRDSLAQNDLATKGSRRAGARSASKKAPASRASAKRAAPARSSSASSAKRSSAKPHAAKKPRTASRSTTAPAKRRAASRASSKPSTRVKTAARRR